MKRIVLTLTLVLMAVLVCTALYAQAQTANVYVEGEIEVTDMERAAGNPIFEIKLASGGVLRGELYPDIAPQSVGNFIALANSGFYDGLIFHRVIPNFMIQGGCPKGMGTGGPGYGIKGEFASNGVANDLKHTYGVLSMARSQMPNSAGSQFFVMTSTSPHLDGSYAGFGKITSGMEHADQIVAQKRDRNDKPIEPQGITSIRVETFGKDYPFDQL